MARNPNTRRDGAAFDAATIAAVWNKGRPIPNYSQDVWRHDMCGAVMKRSGYGNTQSENRWEIDHIKPVAKAGVAHSLVIHLPFDTLFRARENEGSWVDGLPPAVVTRRREVYLSPAPNLHNYSFLPPRMLARRSVVLMHSYLCRATLFPW